MVASRRRPLGMPASGLHTSGIYMSEGGMRGDRILLSTDAAPIPSGSRPAEAARSGGGSGP